MGGTVLPGMGGGLPAVNVAGGVGGGGMNPLLGGAGMPPGLGLHGVPGGAGGAVAGSQGGGSSGGVVPGGGLSVAANVLSAQQRMFNSVGAAWRPGLPSSAAFQSQQMHDGSSNAPPMPVLVSGWKVHLPCLTSITIPQPRLLVSMEAWAAFRCCISALPFGPQALGSDDCPDPASTHTTGPIPHLADSDQRCISSSDWCCSWKWHVPVD